MSKGKWWLSQSIPEISRCFPIPPLPFSSSLQHMPRQDTASKPANESNPPHRKPLFSAHSLCRTSSHHTFHHKVQTTQNEPLTSQPHTSIPSLLKPPRLPSPSDSSPPAHNAGNTSKNQNKKTSRMATVTSASVSIPSFTGLKAGSASNARVSASAKVSASPLPRLSIKASLKDVGVAVVATAASAMIASNAMAIDVLLGGDDGSLAFVPSVFSVSAGEKIVFKNNAGFPHNIIFDEDSVPSGVDVSKISMGEEDLLNSKGETYEVALSTKGEYSFYCAPHQGAGMVGKVTVN